MIDWINAEPHWAWLVAGLVLCALEMLVPGVFLLWLGIAALLTGVIAIATGVGPTVQLLLFAVLSIIAVYAGRTWFTNLPPESDDPLLNDRLSRLIGETVTVETPLSGGRGRVRVGDSVWPAEGPDLAAGANAVVVASRGGALIIEPR
jgi:inner membrane protein